MSPDLITVSDALVDELTPLSDDADDVCPLCRSGRTRPTDLCFSCERTSGQVAIPCGTVIPISYYTTPSSLRERMHDYKEHATESVRRTESRNVAAIAARYIAEHSEQLATWFGTWDATVAVPSTHHTNAPALQVAIEDNFPEPFAPFERPLAIGDGTMGFRQADERGFSVVDAGIAGRRYLLIDDTFTTGARVQSAHHALRAAGASISAVIIVTRKITPSIEYGTERLWTRQSQVAFDFRAAPWWTRH